MVNIKNVAVVGANGTMGQNIAAIFAAFGNATVYLVSRSKEKSQAAREKASLSVKAESITNKMEAADYSQLEECVYESDLIFEACVEDWEIKESIHKEIASILNKLPKEIAEKKIICTGTSGLSVTKLSELYGEVHTGRFIGMHFFNPPYSMTLCELIPTKYTDLELFGDLYEYTKIILGRTTVVVKDSPAFLGNRIGFQFINEALQIAEQYKFNGGIDYIDAIIGPFTGRAMPPLVTANFVGLDVHKAIVDNIHSNTYDFAHDTFVLPNYVATLVKEGKVGRKAGGGLYKTVTHDSGMKMHFVYDIETKNYRPEITYSFPFVEKMISFIAVGEYKKAFEVLVNNRSIEADICCQLLLKYILYAISAADSLGENIQSADDVMATGFNWCPPLAMIEVFSGKKRFIGLCKERIESKTLEETDFDNLVNKIEKSKYDYRKYIKAKR